MVKRIRQVFIFSDSPAKIPYNRSIDVELYYAVIEYENEKTKIAYYLIRLTDLEDFDDHDKNCLLYTSDAADE